MGFKVIGKRCVSVYVVNEYFILSVEDCEIMCWGEEVIVVISEEVKGNDVVVLIIIEEFFINLNVFKYLIGCFVRIVDNFDVVGNLEL